MRIHARACRRTAVLALFRLAVACTAILSPDLHGQAGAQTPAAASRGSGGINRPEHLEKASLILVSFDGFRADYLDRYNLPNFRRAIARGARAQAMRPVFPAITFPNHYSLVTGLYPGHH